MLKFEKESSGLNVAKYWNSDSHIDLKVKTTVQEQIKNFACITTCIKLNTNNCGHS